MGQDVTSRSAKRDQLVRAAADVLLTEGVAGCTVRAIADRSGLSKSAIHYYFEEVNDLVELAWELLMGEFIHRMEAAAEAAGDDPGQRLWAAAEIYVRVGSGHDRRIPMMAFDFLIVSRRRGDTRAAAVVMERITELFGKLLAATSHPDPWAVTPVLMSALIGTVVRAEIGPLDTRSELAAIARAIGLEPPEA